MTLEQVLNIKPTEVVPSWMFDVWALRWWRKSYWWPFWADKRETQNQENMPEWIQQIVWHTPVQDLIILPHIIYCDTFWKQQSNRILALEL